eukprot:scaffold247_cov172-Ochromonas_danica.AAC.14
MSQSLERADVTVYLVGQAVGILSLASLIVKHVVLRDLKRLEVLLLDDGFDPLLVVCGTRCGRPRAQGGGLLPQSLRLQ